MRQFLMVCAVASVFVVALTTGSEVSVAAGTITATSQLDLDAPQASELGSPRCYQCNSSSTGACKRNSNANARCWGTKKECFAKGCRGMSGSSSSCKGYGANIPRC